MENNCFYCDYKVDERKHHYITFFKDGSETEELLCNACYEEWLEGIKE
ncbi:hypothetical protein [Metabacillus arenae]|uniref:Uncharacterized protein n=1 Tax=Metabacillus arenae TaxID=2771434 RepID=A0A926N8H8_9BACI|nr:hypothetical protein [Metabacillus arenae]MBD1379417.1 hypothetical protein [Metabacillus arenae]